MVNEDAEPATSYLAALMELKSGGFAEPGLPQARAALPDVPVDGDSVDETTEAAPRIRPDRDRPRRGLPFRMSLRRRRPR